MIDFYNAFISYRHADLDSKIAYHIQKQLEHFHVPHKLKKKLKHEKITRIFRDKDELPITSDLTETITNALEKAEYLIVICSTNTKESTWVKREINTFLKTHTMDKVLTVLCNGEPYEVIPEELLTTKKEYVDEAGMTHTVEVPIEPLSCDYRLPKSTADKEELPRLASALLGCSYDELQRRRRQYRIRRATAIVAAVFAILLALGSYLGYMNRKINNSYIESLRSRSLYLSNEAEQLLADGKRTDALQLALAALPNDSQTKMPITAEAQRAITDVTASYESLTGHNNYSAIWNYKTTKPVNMILLSENEKYLAAYDKAGKVYCWNTQTNELLLELDAGEIPIDLIFLDEGQLLVLFSNRMESYHVESNSSVWSYKRDSDFSFYKGDVRFADHSLFFDNGNGEVARLSARDGSIIDTYAVMTDMFFAKISRLAVSPDGKKLAFVNESTSFGTLEAYIYDTETDNIHTSAVPGYILTKFQFINNDRLILCTDNDIIFASTSYSNDITFLATGCMQFYCFDTTLKQLWLNELEYTDTAINYGAMDLPSRDSVLLYIGNHAVIANENTGEIVNDYMTSSSIVTVADFYGNGVPGFICRHGELIFALNSEENEMISYNILGDKVSEGIISDKIYSVDHENSDIICYYHGLEDDEWNSLDSYGGFTTGSSYQRFYNDGENLVIASNLSDSHIITVSVIDMNSAKLVFSEDIEYKGDYLSHFDIQNVDDEIYGLFGNGVYFIDLDKEKIEDAGIELNSFDDISNGMIINASVEQSELVVEVWEVDGSNHKEFKPIDATGLYTSSIGTPVYIEQLNKIFIPVENRLFVGDLDSKKISEMDVPDGWFVKTVMPHCITASDDGSSVFFSDGSTFFVTDDSLEEKYSDHCFSSNRISAVIKGDTLYIVSDEFLMLYDAENGTLINKISFDLNGTGKTSLYFDDKNHQVFIQIGDSISIFDAESWIKIKNIENVYCYHEGTDRFFVYSYQTSDACIPGYIKHYTIDELIEKAYRYLGGQEVTEELKAKYGI